MKSSCLYQANFQHQNQECPREFGKTFGNTSFLTENSNKENAPNFFNVQRHYMKENRVFNAFPYNNKENLGMNQVPFREYNFSKENIAQSGQNENANLNMMEIDSEVLGNTNTRNTETDVSMANPQENFVSNQENAPKNEQEVQEYFPEIFTNFVQEENMNLPQCGYMRNQIDITEKMRGILIDWLVEVHLKYKLNPETLFLTVNIVDRFLSKNIIMRTRLQLVGVSAMLIASKYEDIFPPEVADFEYISDKAFTKKEIADMESQILNSLNFSLGISSTYRFIEFYKIILNLYETIFYLAWYLIELALIDYNMIKYRPSQIAVSACFIASKICNRCNFDLASSTGYTEDDLKQCCKDLLNLVHNAPNSNLQSVYKKFSLSKYNSVSKEIANF